MPSQLVTCIEQLLRYYLVFFDFGRDLLNNTINPIIITVVASIPHPIATYVARTFPVYEVAKVQLSYSFFMQFDSVIIKPILAISGVTASEINPAIIMIKSFNFKFLLIALFVIFFINYNFSTPR